MRADDIGFFWERLPQEKTRSKGEPAPRVLPETPETGWRPSAEFPNLAAAKVIAVDTETKDPELLEKGPGVRRDGHIVGLAIGTDDGGRWYFPMRHEVEPEYNLDPDAVMAWARDALAGPQPKVGANLLYDFDYLAQSGVTVGGQWMDVQITEPLLNENRRSYSLDALGKEYLGEGKTSSTMRDWIEKAYGNKRGYRSHIWKTSPRLVGPYAEGDVDLPLRILEKQRLLIDQGGFGDLFALENDLLPMLLAMRRGGVRVEVSAAKSLDDELSAEIERQQRALDDAAGFAVNTSAGADLARMFDRIGVEYPRTAAGNPSFVKEWLEHHSHPACAMVVGVRKLLKFRDTFIRGYVLDSHIDGRIYCLFHSMRDGENGTVSGRFSSSMPNLQNIPSRDEHWGPRIRSLFLPDDGCSWVRHDWSQIEYRFLAHVGVGANAKEVQQLYRDDPTTDFHQMVLDMIGWGPEMRKPAKNINFGLVYGMGTKLLATTLGMSVEQAKVKIFDVYHSKVPFVKDTYDRAAMLASTRGYVKTVYGRRARFPLFEPSSGWSEEVVALPEDEARSKWGGRIRRAFTHKALNRVLQGSAADLMKIAMRDIWKSGVYEVLPVAHLTVHDELDHSCPPGEAANAAVAEVRHLMENAMKLRVPILAAEERGPSWGECE